jgi:hypothetical protein
VPGGAESIHKSYHFPSRRRVFLFNLRFVRVAFVAFVCACSSTPQIFGPVYDSGPWAGGDAAPDATDAATSSDVVTEAQGDGSTCTSVLALVGGSSTTLFGAGGPATSTLSAATIVGTLADCGTNFGCANPAAIIPLGGGFLAAFATSSGTLESATFQTSWSSPAAIAAAATIDGPWLTAIGTTGHLLYQGTDYKFYHGQYASSAWDSASDPVGGAGANQSYGVRGPVVATASGDLVALQAGSNSYLYDQTWSGSWQAAVEQGGAAIQDTLPPTIIALTGGTSELLAAYLRNGDYKVMAVARTGGMWNVSPTLVDPNAFSNDPVVLAPLPNGGALLVFRGSDQTPYFCTWDGVSTWTTAAPIVPTNNPTIAALPSVAAGVCGAEAFVAFATSSGVEIAAFAGGVFGPPVVVTGTTGAKFVAISTSPE